MRKSRGGVNLRQQNNAANRIILIALHKLRVSSKNINMVQATAIAAQACNVQIPDILTRRNRAEIASRIAVALNIQVPPPKPKSVKKPKLVLVKPQPRVAKIAQKPHSDVPQNDIDAFYASWEWKRVRYDFLKNLDRRCQCCGATPGHNIRIVVDHIKPIRFHWNLRLLMSNLQLLCDDCNMGKGSRDETDWRLSQFDEDGFDRALSVVVDPYK